MAPTSTWLPAGTRRWDRLAGEPQRVQMASDFVTYSATAIRVGIGANGLPV